MTASDPRVHHIGVIPREQEYRAGCIALLEDLLAEAKAGRGFETVYVVATYPDNRALRQAWTREPGALSTIDIVGRLEHLKFALLRSNPEGEGDE